VATFWVAFKIKFKYKVVGVGPHWQIWGCGLNSLF